MTQRQQIKVAVLRGLLAADGTPMPSEAVVGVALTVFPAPTRAEALIAIKEMETDGWIAGLNDSLTGATWTLTATGAHRAQKL